MTEIKGVLTTLNNALPNGVDPARLAIWRLRDSNQSYQSFRSLVGSSFDGLNQELLQAWGGLAFVTYEDHFEYPNGGAVTDMPDTTDLDIPESEKYDTVAHMIDLRVKSARIGKTARFFRDARESFVLAQIKGHVQRGRQTFEKALLTRFFTNTSNQLGSSGYDVPFANNSSGVTYAPPAFGGKTFLTTHNHYIGYDSGSNDFGDMLDGLALTVTEHGGDGELVAMVAEADASDYRALDNFIKPISGQIVIVDQGGRTSGNTFFSRGEVQQPQMSGTRHIGSYQTPYGEVELRATSRIPTKYAGMYRTYGLNNDQNPLAIRVHPNVGFGFRLLEEPSFDNDFPIKSIIIEIEYGISAGQDRTAGAAGYLISGGTWVNPTIA